MAPIFGLALEWDKYKVKATKNVYYVEVAQLRDIKQLRGPILTQFCPPPTLEWTIVDILHDT